MRYPIYYLGGLLALFAVGVVALRPTARHLPPLPTHAAEREPIVAPEPTEIPPRPAPAPPPSPFTPRESILLRYFARHEPESDCLCLPHTAEQQRRDRERVERAERAFAEVGGTNAEGVALYLRVLTRTPLDEWGAQSHILSMVAQIDADRSAFRQPAVERLTHYKLAVARSAMWLLAKIGTAEDAPVVAAQFRFVEFDDTIEPRDHAYFVAALELLAKFGTEAEIAAIDRGKDQDLLWSDKKFWAKAEACKKTIRERLAKQTPADKK